ncbi:MAG: hypothetical protein RIT45_1667 [Pseudomonadota bacterium]
MLETDAELKARLSKLSGTIFWAELAPHFARGVVVVVAPELALMDVAAAFVRDDRSTVERWLNRGELVQAADEHAIEWQNRGPVFRTVVTPPWVLVQETDSETVAQA